MPIPIFIIVCDRLQVLKESIASYYKNIKTTPFEIVIHDSNTTFQPTIDYLNKLEDEGIKIYRYNTPNKYSDYTLNVLVGETVKRWYQETESDSDYFVTTDPDVVLDNTPGDILEFYRFLLRKFPDVDAVGPMLRLDDIPDHYSLKKLATKTQVDQFWRQIPLVVNYNNNLYHYQRARTGQTFAMYRRGFLNKYSEVKLGIRTYAPYLARHLDWYIDPNNMTEDHLYYMRHAGSKAHWSAGFLRSRSLRYQRMAGLLKRRCRRFIKKWLYK